MRVRADHERCEGYGTCAELLPSVFRLDEWGYVDVGDGVVPAADEARARQAVSECPMGALSIEEA